MECYCCLRNIQDLLSDGKRPSERRFGESFTGPVIPFGSMIEHHPISAKNLSRIHQFGKKVLRGIFLGCALYAGGIWKGDILVADLEELENLGAPEFHARRLNGKEVITPKSGENFIFPDADGKVNLFGRDQVLRTSTLIQEDLERGEGREGLREESDGRMIVITLNQASNSIC